MSFHHELEETNLLGEKMQTVGKTKNKTTKTTPRKAKDRKKALKLA